MSAHGFSRLGCSAGCPNANGRRALLRPYFAQAHRGARMPDAEPRRRPATRRVVPAAVETMVVAT